MNVQDALPIIQKKMDSLKPERSRDEIILCLRDIQLTNLDTVIKALLMLQMFGKVELEEYHEEMAGNEYLKIKFFPTTA